MSDMAMLRQQTVALLLSLRVALVSAFIIIVVILIFPLILFVFFLVWLLPHEQLHGYQPVGKVRSDAFV
jgi:hypothetical protein